MLRAKEDRRALIDYFSKHEQLRKHVPTVITRCLAIAVATPNTNWNQEEYQKGVIKPYRRIQTIQDELDRTGERPTIEQMREALEMLKSILATKRVPVREQIEWFNQILMKQEQIIFLKTLNCLRRVMNNSGEIDGGFNRRTCQQKIWKYSCSARCFT